MEISSAYRKYAFSGEIFSSCVALKCKSPTDHNILVRFCIRYSSTLITIITFPTCTVRVEFPYSLYDI